MERMNATVSNHNELVSQLDGTPRAKILISTFVYDVTALTVSTALESIGCQVFRWFMPDFTSKQTITYELSDDSSPSMGVGDGGGMRAHFDCDSAWFRRISAPVINREIVHEDDLKFAKREASIFLRNAQNLVEPGTNLVNSAESRLRADDKLTQLRLAKRAGLKIPATLAGNDPRKIRTFIEERAAIGVIYKPFLTHAWDEGGKCYGSYTASLDINRLPSDPILMAVPGIYQQRIRKKFEVRTTVFGRTNISAKIDSSAFEGASDDWRLISHEAQSTAWKAHQLPSEVADRLYDFMGMMGLAFGCVDFIVTDDDEYVFLEVNEQGQFLWLEASAPELPLLDTLCRFLVSGNSYATLRPQWNRLVPDENLFKDGFNQAVANDVAAHVVDDLGGSIAVG